MTNPHPAQQQPMRDDNSHDNQSVALTSGNSCFASCAAYELNLCEVIVKLEQSDADCHAINLPLTASLYTIPARRTIHHPDVSSEFVSSICKGWATLAVVLPDDRRQILSFLLPGDMFSIASLYEPISGHMVESVTEVTYRSFKRGDLRTIIFARPDLHARFTAAWIEEKRWIEQLAVDLGCRMADERIARLILNLMERLAKRGMVQDMTIEFPLRHYHIADATGLTSVHVSRTLSDFRRSGLIAINDRMLTVLDIEKLHRRANLPLPRMSAFGGKADIKSSRADVC